MIQRTPKNVFYYFFLALQYSSFFLIPVVGVLLKLPAGQIDKAMAWSLLLGTAIGYVQSEAWWLLLLLSGIAGSSKIICSHIGAPWVWRTVQTTMDELYKHAFRSNADPSHHHRVTLFKHKLCRLRISPWRLVYWPWGRGRGPCSGWLVPVARSGHTTQRTKTVFLAPDDADAAEGIAGLAWSCNKMIPMSNLPDLYTDKQDAAIQTYAEKTWLAPNLVKKRIEKRLSHARSYLGIPIEVKGNRWGVLVLDSRSPDGIRPPDNLSYDAYKVMAKFLERLLERG